MAQFFKNKDFESISSTSVARPGEVYITNPPLNEAIHAAFLLKQPLLLTGDPGTGKTTMGMKLAKELNRISNGAFYENALFFSTKSTSFATDLFYAYDAISHFQQVNLKEAEFPVTAETFITLQALGIAILSGNRDLLEPESTLLKQLPKLDEHLNPKDFVIIIDEIDKASRDFPNDILHEIETLSFTIKELGSKQFHKDKKANIFVILTSNSEKSLPEAFLRRCVFHHIEFPSEPTLRKILAAHQIVKTIGEDVDDSFYAECIELFSRIREVCSDKKPSTAELIAWTKYLAYHNFDFSNQMNEVLLQSLSIIVKSKNDLKIVTDSRNLFR